MGKTMWYAVDKDGMKGLYPYPLERDLEGNQWVSKNLAEAEENCEYIEDFFEEDYWTLEDTTRIELGLPEITWKDEPIEVNLFCKNV